MKNKKSSDRDLENLVDSDEDETSEKDEEDSEDEESEENILEEDFDSENVISEINSSPSLKRIAFSSKGFNLENQIFSSAKEESEVSVDDSDEFRYDSSSKTEDEKNYSSYNSGIVGVSDIDMDNLGEDVLSEKNPEVFFSSSREVENKNKMYEKKYEARRIDMDNLGREKPFEEKQKKYSFRPSSR